MLNDMNKIEKEIKKMMLEYFQKYRRYSFLSLDSIEQFLKIKTEEVKLINGIIQFKIGNEYFKCKLSDNRDILLTRYTPDINAYSIKEFYFDDIKKFIKLINKLINENKEGD